MIAVSAPACALRTKCAKSSAGEGAWRGAFGHRVEFGPLPGYTRPLSFFLNPDRLLFPPRGLAGGHDGPLTELRLNGEPLGADALGSGQVTLTAPRDRFALAVPGGAGYGDPAERDQALVDFDRATGLTR